MIRAPYKCTTLLLTTEVAKTNEDSFSLLTYSFKVGFKRNYEDNSGKSTTLSQKRVQKSKVYVSLLGLQGFLYLEKLIDDFMTV